MSVLLRPGVWRISGGGGEENAYPAPVSSDSPPGLRHQDAGGASDGILFGSANAFCQRTFRKEKRHFPVGRTAVSLLFPAGNGTKP